MSALARGAGAADAGGGVGVPLLGLPAHAVGGSAAVELWLAALAALGLVAAAAAARRVAPDPYATVAVIAAAASVPALAHATSIGPAAPAGAALAGAVVLAVRARERPRGPDALWAAALVAALPWLHPAYLLPGGVVLGALAAWLVTRGSGLRALACLELGAGSVLAYVTVGQRLYGGPFPGELRLAPGAAWAPAAFPEAILGWAPLLVAAGAGAVALWRSRRTRIARAVPERREAEATTALALGVCLAVALVAVAQPRLLVAGIPCSAIPAAWGLRRLRGGGAVLAAASAVLGAAYLAAARSGLADPWLPVLPLME